MKAQIIAIAALQFALRSHAQSTISSGSGFGTYYYDVEQVQTCGTDFSAQNTGVVECGSSSLDQINSNYLVAMSHTELAGDMAKYCGKKVIVSVNGVASSLPLFIGDGCQRCAGGSSDVWDPNAAIGLDFSYSVLTELSADACADGHIPISWEIVDETLYNFDTDGSGSAEGPVAGNSAPPVATAANPAPTTAPAAQTQEAPVASPSSTDVGRLVDVPTTLATVASSSPVNPVSTGSPAVSSDPLPVAGASSAATSPVGAGTPTISSDPVVVTDTSFAAASSVSAGTPIISSDPLLATAASSAIATPIGTGFSPIPSGLSTAALPTASVSSGPCEMGAWQCNGNVLEQCLDSSWTFRFICDAELTCQGGIRPYCAPPGFDLALELNSTASSN